MMEILTYPHPVLRFKTKLLKRVDNDVRQCATRMIAVMKSENGVGLSANQVGLPLSMFVTHWKGRDSCFINPTIKSHGRVKSKEEGCLSFPDLQLDIKRQSKCHFTAWDLNGDKIDKEVSGDLCRILQHEMDHLQGTLFVDRISDFQRESRRVKYHLDGFEYAWKHYPRNFPTDAFNELLYQYCGVPRPEPV